MPHADRRVADAPEADDLIRQAVDDLLDEPADARRAGDADDLLASMADDAIDRMLAGDPTPPPSDAPATPPDEADLDALLRGEVSRKPRPSADDSAAARVAAELDLDDDPLADAPDVPPPVAEIEADAAIEERPGPAAAALPLWARPLAWMNKPLDRAGDNARDVVGKIALVTFANAAAVLIFLALRG